MQIDKREEIEGKYFNYWLYKNYNIFSIVTVDEKITITGDIDPEQEQQIEDFYNNLQPYVFDEDYMAEFLKGKYELNAERGTLYAHEISAKMVTMIQNGELSLEEANAQSQESEKVISELRKGYYHSAYMFHTSYEPLGKLQNLHEEIKEHLKSYVNGHYPTLWHVE